MTNALNLLRRLASLGFYALAGYLTWLLASRWWVYVTLPKGDGMNILFTLLAGLTIAWLFVFAVSVWLGKTFWVDFDRDVA